MKRFIIPAMLLAPTLAFAQGLTNLTSLVEGFGGIVSLALPIVAGLALLAFFWGLAVFIFSGGSEEKKEQGKHLMIWSVVALFVMVSIWGLVEWLAVALGVTQNAAVTLPTIPGLDG